MKRPWRMSRLPPSEPWAGAGATRGPFPGDFSPARGRALCTGHFYELSKNRMGTWLYSVTQPVTSPPAKTNRSIWGTNGFQDWPQQTEQGPRTPREVRLGWPTWLLSQGPFPASSACWRGFLSPSFPWGIQLCIFRPLLGGSAQPLESSCLSAGGTST